MNKLDALIEACKYAPERLMRVRSTDIRRILEAVREDMSHAGANCMNERVSGNCTAGPVVICRKCRLRSHAAIRTALEQL